MENNQVVEWEDKCPVCKEVIKFKITKDSNRNYKAYILGDGCEHLAPGFIDQSKYRMLCNLLKQLYSDPDLLFSLYKKKQEIEKLKLLGVDVSKFL